MLVDQKPDRALDLPVNLIAAGPLLKIVESAKQ